MASLKDNTLRIVLVGKTGSGKSGTANTILGRREFQSKIAAHAVTKSCQKASQEWKGRQLLVVDTPGLFDTKETLQTTCKEISSCVITSCPGPHAIVLVMRLGRYTEEEQNTVALIKAVFGKEAMKHMIVLFTGKDELEEDQSLEDFISESDVDLRNIIKECGDRCCAFNNRSKDKAEKEAQVQELVEIIDRMVRGNGGAYFSDNVYKDAEERLQRQEEVLKKIYDDQLQNEILIVEKEYEKLIEEKKEKIEKLKMKYEEKIKNVREEAEKNVFAQVLDGILKVISKVWHKFWK